MSRTAICIATSETQAQDITDRLRRAGFTGDDISVLLPGGARTQEPVPAQDALAPHDTITADGLTGKVGGTVGWVAVGSTVGWWIGLGVLAIPGVGMILAAGPILALLAGAAAGAAVGGIAGALVGIGMPESEAEVYETRIKAGRILISIHAGSAEAIQRALQIFREAGAEDIASTNLGVVGSSAGVTGADQAAIPAGEPLRQQYGAAIVRRETTPTGQSMSPTSLSSATHRPGNAKHLDWPVHNQFRSFPGSSDGIG